MKIAVIGGGASGIATAYLLDQKGHQVTVFEREPRLGGHIRTLNKNVQPNHSDCDAILENGVLEFPTAFHHFIQLMNELEVELEPVDIGSAIFLKDGRHIMSGKMIQRNFWGLNRLFEYLRLDTMYARSAGFWVRMKFSHDQDFLNQPLSQPLKSRCIRNCWLKLLTMYSYSIPFELIDEIPAELAIPALRHYIFVNWVRVKGGVYSYIEKILERFRGRVVLNAKISAITRIGNCVHLEQQGSQRQTFNKLVFATPPDQVLALLNDPTPSEIRRFSAWEANHATTILHTDTSFYSRFRIQTPSEFDFFQTEHGWGYNAYLNQLCGIKSQQTYSLAFQLNSLVQPENILHIQKHHTPLYTVEALRHRNEIIETNGENQTYYAGAYLGDGLHEGAIASAYRVANLIESKPCKSQA